MLYRLSITRQFTLLGTLGVLMTLAALGLGLRTSYDLEVQAKKTQVTNLVKVAVTVAEGFVAEAREGKMTTAEAQKEALAALGAARFDGGNYYFVFNYDGITLEHPNKKYVGTNRYNVKDIYGNVLNGPTIAAAREGHPIFHRYYQVKRGSSVPQPKMSTMIAVPEWRWVIGTGMYIDDVKASFVNHVITLAGIFLPLFCGFLVLIYFMRRGVSGLLAAMTMAMKRLAEGELGAEVPCIGRGDEIGAMAGAVQVFKENALRTEELKREQERDRQAAEAERGQREAEREAAAKRLAFVVESVAAGLEKLAAGILTFRLDQAFAPEYEQLRTDFNAAMERLQDAMKVIVGNTAAIRSGTGEITAAADDLSRRTEQQAASLEETAAALDQITATVRKTAEGATHAREVVGVAQADAERSGVVVGEAVAAMSRIETSSQQISNIIGVIDEIAFQTNLLALNAGVEAARAGDAGRGFAVVASEVRALAQRSADAAKEIKALISASTQQVVSGVDLVGQTGKALQRIVGQIGEINAVVAQIAASAQEQATGLHQVNVAVNQMDQVTQQNAAMVEQSTAASHSLAQETDELATLIGRFQIGDAAEPADYTALEGRRQEAPRKPAAARPITARRASAVNLSAAKSTERASRERIPELIDGINNWKEF